MAFRAYLEGWENIHKSTQMEIRMAKAIMIQGTMSNVGKSLVTAGLLRIFKEDGYNVAPFKSQNMALNSYITKEGLEMGRAQAMQAEACGIEPLVCMNPILLKPVTDMGSQVIVNGRVVGDMRAWEYFKRKKEFKKDILAAYEQVQKNRDIIVIEGAGSPAEINLKQDDIVNMGMARMADAEVLLVGDIDRGGVFAQLYGTIMLLEEEEKNRILGVVINKFRGDKEILKPGLAMLEEKCGKPILGVIPYMDVDIEEEDSLSEDLNKRSVTGLLDIAVIRLPHISNFTDFDVWKTVEEVSVRYVSNVKEVGHPDLIILPGTKNTMGDLAWLRQCGLEAVIKQKAARGDLVFGICGGYQMLGKELLDPYREEGLVRMDGMGLLPVRTVFAKTKMRSQVSGRVSENLKGEFGQLCGAAVKGYEIHAGVTEAVEDGTVFSQVTMEGDGGFQSRRSSEAYYGRKQDGMVCRNVCGTYIHGVFDSSAICMGMLDILLGRKGIKTKRRIKQESYREYKEKQYGILADILRESLNINKIYEMLL